MRPKYETVRDLQHEEKAMLEVAKVFNCIARKLPVSYGFDYSLSRDGQVLAAVEFKKRTKKYPTLLLSLLKIKTANALRDVGLRPLLVVEWPDGIYFHEFRKNYDISYGGRTDRGDSADIEPCVFIPIDEFQKVLTK